MLSWLRGLKGGPPQKAALLQLKKVKVGTGVYTIRRINPLLDFRSDNMPTIFSAYASARKVDPVKAAAAVDHKKAVEEMMAVVRAGVVEPVLVEVGKGDKRGREDGVTVEDIFRDAQHGLELYLAIMDHTLNRFTGLRKVFFSSLIRRLQSTVSQQITDAVQAP
jgi:hypothetical protein